MKSGSKINSTQKSINDIYTERFHLLMKQIRIDQMLKRATIIHPNRKD
jgi:hypothetical protein